jgi:hypothetical protein
MLVAILIPGTLLIIALLLLILYARAKYGKLDGLGIPVIPPTFILGSTPDVHEKVQHLEDIERFKKYGPIWGVYNM